MAEITFPYAPGFADVPDSALAAEQYAQGVLLGRIAENAAMGMVRPEVFVTEQKHGDTVALPVSPVDGYQYSRDELVYMWGITSTANPSTGAPSANNQLIWFAQWFVDQTTGVVTSEIWYSNDDGKKTNKTNDGTLTVYTIGSRRKTSMSLADVPFYVEHAETDYATDKALHETPLQDLSRNAKFAIVNSEAIYMGTYKSGDVVALPVSPVDGYRYSQSEVIWLWSWVWTTDGDSYSAPVITVPIIGNLLTQLHRISASVDADGTVHTNVVYYNSHEIDQGATMGRIAVTALCSRSGFRTQDLTVLATQAPWNVNGSLNSAYPYAAAPTAASMTRLPVTPGDVITIQYKSGTWGIGGIHGLFDTAGDTNPANWAQPGNYLSSGNNRQAALIVSFVDASGQLVVAPVAPGLFGSYTVPAGAAYVQFGINDDTSFVDNVGSVVIQVSGFDGTGSGVAGIGNCNEFSWFDSSLLGPGNPARTDLIVQIVKNVREAVARPEFFDAGDFANGATVPLPTSPIDGYVYTRDELVYLYEMGHTGMNTGGNIRLVGWSFSINQATGVVSISEIHKRDGGRQVTDNEGTLRVKIIAIRSASHVIPPPSTISDTGGSSSTPGSSGNVDNGGMDNFSGASQTIADGWNEVDYATGTRSYSQATGLSPIGNAQGISVNSGIGNLGGVRNARSQVCPGDRWVLKFRAAASAAITTGFIARLRFWNSDATASVTADLVSGALGTSVVNELIGVQIPAQSDTNLWTGRGLITLSAAPAWVPSWVDLEFVVSAPDVTTTVSIDDVDWLPATREVEGREIDTADPADGDVLTWDDTAKKASWQTGGGGGATISSVQQDAYIYAPDTGSADAYAVSISPAPTLVAGSRIIFKAANSNTGASTLAVNGGSPIAIKKNGVGDLAAGDISAGQMVSVIYDGTNFQIVAGAVGPAGVSGGTAGFGSLASRPSASSVGSGYVYYVANSPFYYVSDGTNWKSYFKGLSVSEPNVGSFGWVNQGAASVDVTKGGILLASSADAANSFKIYKKAAPATPYTWTVRFSPALTASNFESVGLVLRESSTGKLYVFIVAYNLTGSNGFEVRVLEYTDPTTFSSDVTTGIALFAASSFLQGDFPLITLQIVDPGSGNLQFNLIFGGDSLPSTNKFGIAVSARTSFMAGGPDEIGYCINPRNGTYPASAWFVDSTQ